MCHAIRSAPDRQFGLEQCMVAETIHCSGGADASPVHRGCVHIGGIALALNSASLDEILVGPELEEFRTKNGRPDIEVNIEWVDDLVVQQGKPEFQSGAVWTLFRDSEEHIFDFI